MRMISYRIMVVILLKITSEHIDQKNEEIKIVLLWKNMRLAENNPIC